MKNRFEVGVVNGAYYVLDTIHGVYLTSRRFTSYALIAEVVQQMNDWENSESL